MTFQRKLSFLGLGSLGTIFGVNHILKGDTDKLLPELTNEQGEEEELAPNLNQEIVKPTVPKPKPAPKPKGPWKPRKFNYTRDGDVGTGGIRNGKLKEFFYDFFKDDDATKARINAFTRHTFDWFIATDPRTTQFAKDRRVDWDKVKKAMNEANIHIS